MDYKIEQTASNEYTLYKGYRLDTPYMYARKSSTSKRWQVFGGDDDRGGYVLGCFTRKQAAIDYMIACWEDFKAQEEKQIEEDTLKCEKPYEVCAGYTKNEHMGAEFSELIDAENWARACKKICKDDFSIYYRSKTNRGCWMYHVPAQRRVHHFPEIVAKSGNDLKEMPQIKSVFLCKRTATLWQLNSVINEYLILVRLGGEKLTNAIRLNELVDGFIPVKSSVDATDVSPEVYAGYREIVYQVEAKKLSNPGICSSSSFPKMIGAAMAKAHLEKGEKGLIELGEINE